jgi:nucleoside-diphosphate-sugar epimerase
VRTLVTGGSGFIGSQLVRALLEQGDEVVVLLRPSSDAWRLADVLGWVEVVRTDAAALDPTDPPRELKGVQRVFHLAADGVKPSAAAEEAVVSSNVIGTSRLLELAGRLDVERFVYCGSCFEYGSGDRLREDACPRPNSAYAASKAAGWLLACAHGRAHGLPVVSLRPFTVFGPYEAPHRLIPSAVLRALEGSPIELTGGEQTRDFVYVQDAIRSFLAAGTADGVAGETFNVCTGVATSVRSLVEEVVELTVSGSELRFGAIPYREEELWTLSGDPTAAAACLGWVATTSLSDGLRATIDWFRAEGNRHPAYTREPAPF